MKFSILGLEKILEVTQPDTFHSPDDELRPKNRNYILKYIFIPEIELEISITTYYIM